MICLRREKELRHEVGGSRRAILLFDRYFCRKPAAVPLRCLWELRTGCQWAGVIVPAHLIDDRVPGGKSRMLPHIGWERTARKSERSKPSNQKEGNPSESGMVDPEAGPASLLRMFDPFLFSLEPSGEDRNRIFVFLFGWSNCAPLASNQR